MAKQTNLPGCLYQRRGRWYWKVQLPGEDHFKMRPLVPMGGRYATRDRKAAEQIAKEMLLRAASDNDMADITFDGSIAALVALYQSHAREYYNRPKSYQEVQLALKPLLEEYAGMAAEDFGPLKLQQLRRDLIDRGLHRTTINRRIGIIKRIFRWGVAQQIVPSSVFHGLQAVDGLRRGRSKARETEPVKPVAEDSVRRVLPFATPTVAAMIELQMLTGMRSGELVTMRPCDIDVSGKPWLYRPAAHKTEHHGYQRVIPIGPRGQEILRPFLRRKVDAYCFQPQEALAQWLRARHANRQTRLTCGNRPGSNCTESPRRRPADRYDSASYGKAVQYTIKKPQKSGPGRPGATDPQGPRPGPRPGAKKIREICGLFSPSHKASIRTAAADAPAEYSSAPDTSPPSAAPPSTRASPAPPPAHRR